MDTHDNKLDAQRDIIRHSLPELVNDIGMRMRDEGLRFPVYITHRAMIGPEQRPSSAKLYKEDRHRRVALAGIALRGCERGADECGTSSSWVI
jgi:hypothetical protein